MLVRTPVIRFLFGGRCRDWRSSSWRGKPDLCRFIRQVNEIFRLDPDRAGCTRPLPARPAGESIFFALFGVIVTRAIAWSVCVFLALAASPTYADEDDPEPQRKTRAPAEDNDQRWLDSLARGYTDAQRRQRPIFVVARSATCKFCRELEEQLEKPALREELKRWTRVTIDVDKSPQDARLLAVGPIPALRALAPSGRVVADAEGAQSAQELLKWLKESFDQAASIFPDELDTDSAPEAGAVGRLIRSFRNRDAMIREAVIRKLLPHPDVAAGPIIEAFSDGSLATRLSALELLTEWKAPVAGLDPWRKESLTAERLETLAAWGANLPQPAVADQEELSPAELAAARDMIDRMLHEPAGDGQAIRERLARYGKRLLAEVYDRLKSAATDESRERLTMLRYRLVESQTLAIHWPGGIERLGAADPEMRHRAAQELAERATVADEPLLLELFSDPAPLVREISLRALRQAGGSNVNSALLTLLDDPEPNVRAAVLKHLAESPTAAAVARIARYVQEETDADMVVHAVRVLRGLVGGDEFGMRPVAAQGGSRSKEAKAALFALLEHDSWRVRAEAAEGLGKIIPRYGNKADPAYAEIYLSMVDLLKDEDGFVVSRAVQMLAEADFVAAVDPLVAAAEAHPELAVEVVKALAFGSQQRARADKHLRRFADHADPRLRAASIVGLARPGPGLADDMRKALTDDNAEVRIAAANAFFGVLETRRQGDADKIRLGIYRDAAEVPDSSEEEDVPIVPADGDAVPVEIPVDDAAPPESAEMPADDASETESDGQVERPEDGTDEPEFAEPDDQDAPPPPARRVPEELPVRSPVPVPVDVPLGVEVPGPPEGPDDESDDKTEESSFTGRDRADEWLRVIRAGKVIPKSQRGLRELLEPMLKSDATEERVAALLPLAALGADELVLPEILRLIAAEPRQIARLAEGLPWLLAADRARVLEKMQEKITSPDELPVIANNLAEIRSPQAEQALWHLVMHEKADLGTAQIFAHDLLMAYFPRQYYQLEKAPRKDMDRAITAAKGHAHGPHEVQRFLALAFLFQLEPRSAQEIAQALFDRQTAPVAERTAALQVLLLTMPEAEGVQLALAQFASPQVAFREKAMALLVGDQTALASVGNGEFHLNQGRTSRHVSIGRQSGAAISPEPPEGLSFEPLEPLLQSPDPRTAAHAGYLAALLGHAEGLPPLLAYWKTRAADDVEWMKLVYRAITALNDGSQVPVLREIYNRLNTDNHRYYLNEFYWTIRSMTAPEVLPLRKTIRDEVGVQNLR
jgi:HEAT repeat protein